MRSVFLTWSLCLLASPALAQTQPVKHSLAYKILHPVGSVLRSFGGSPGYVVPLNQQFPQQFYSTPRIGGGYNFTSPTTGYMGYSSPMIGGGFNYTGPSGVQGFSTPNIMGGYNYTPVGNGFGF